MDLRLLIPGISFLLCTLLCGCGTQKVIYKTHGQFTYSDVHGRNNFIYYDTEAGTMTIDRGNHRLTNIRIHDASTEKGSYDIIRDTKRTNKFFEDCSATVNGKKVKLMITTSYTIYDHGYGGLERYNGEPTWLRVEIYFDDGTFTAQGPNTYR